MGSLMTQQSYCGNHTEKKKVALAIQSMVYGLGGVMWRRCLAIYTPFSSLAPVTEWPLFIFHIFTLTTQVVSKSHRLMNDPFHHFKNFNALLTFFNAQLTSTPPPATHFKFRNWNALTKKNDHLFWCRDTNWYLFLHLITEGFTKIPPPPHWGGTVTKW